MRGEGSGAWCVARHMHKARQAHTHVPIEGICTPEALTKVLSLSTSSEVTYASNGSWDRSSDSWEGGGEGGRGRVVREEGMWKAKRLAWAWLGLCFGLGFGFGFGYLLACSPHPLHHMRLSTYLQLA